MTGGYTGGQIGGGGMLQNNQGKSNPLVVGAITYGAVVAYNVHRNNKRARKQALISRESNQFFNKVMMDAINNGESEEVAVYKAMQATNYRKPNIRYEVFLYPTNPAPAFPGENWFQYMVRVRKAEAPPAPAPMPNINNIKALLAEEPKPVTPVSAKDRTVLDDVQAGLRGLGFKAVEIKTVLPLLPETGDPIDLVRQALQLLGKNTVSH